MLSFIRMRIALIGNHARRLLRHVDASISKRSELIVLIGRRSIVPTFVLGYVLHNTWIFAGIVVNISDFMVLRECTRSHHIVTAYV